ncbi:hypothetical protein [Actinomadura violacea]|nr:hypothetical protein [Actinomadura violacea]
MLDLKAAYVELEFSRPRHRHSRRPTSFVRVQRSPGRALISGVPAEV